MDFFARQDQARRKTKWLVFYFVLAVILLIIAVYFVSVIGAYTVLARTRHYYDSGPRPFTLWNPQVFLASTIGVLLVIFFGSAYKTSELSGGGGSVATLMGGSLINQNTTDANERKLLNVVEEMSIASGVPMPQVYVLNEERAINAFAAGHTPGDAAIGVTRGTIEMLSRDELQGVIGHEFSHILNGDMRLNIRLISVIFGLLCLATIGRVMLSMRSDNSRDRNNALPLFGLALIALGAIGVFFGRLIQAAVSRQREFLADASSVQFTRNPGGLSGALQKIGRYSYGSRLESAHAPDMCHMFFGNGLGDSLFGAMATHPPIPDRIHAIDPTWDGTFPPLKPEQAQTIRQAAISDLGHPQKPATQILTSILGTGILAGEDASPPVIRTNTILPNLGNPTPLHLKYAEQMRDQLPEDIRAAARDPQGAAALIYALLLSDDETGRNKQLSGIASQDSPSASEKTAALYPAVAEVAHRTRLPLVNIAIGSLRTLSPPQFQAFSATMKFLVEADGKVELFEFVLQKIIMHHLGPKFSQSRPVTIQYYTIKPVVPDCAVVLSALANVSSEDPGERARAFAAGAPYLRAPADALLDLLPADQCGVDQIGGALDRLNLVVPIIKKNLLDACSRVVGADGVILEIEAELLRAVADSLDCPMPPLGVSETVQHEL